jgi:hypothetical protein
MMMIRLDENYSDYVDMKDPAYPGGKAINAPSEDSYEGTPYLADWMNDVNGFRQALYKKAFGNMDISGNPDNADVSDSVAALERLLNQKAPLKTTLKDEPAAWTLPPVAETELASLLQSARNYLKMLNDIKAPLDDPEFMGIPRVPTKTSAAANEGKLIATEAQVFRSADYTFIIDSNAKLTAWALGLPGSDYSHVLIKSGTWSYASNKNDVSVVIISLEDGRTKSVTGEKGSLLLLSSNSAGGAFEGQAYGIRGPGHGGAVCLFRNVSVKCGYSNRDRYCVAFHVCDDMDGCTGIGQGGDIGATGFDDCRNLSNCVGAGYGDNGYCAGFISCQNLILCAGESVSKQAHGFISCQNLILCTGEGKAITGYSNNEGWGFSSCFGLFGCVGIGHHGNPESQSAAGFVYCVSLHGCKGVGKRASGLPTGGAYGFLNCRAGFGCANNGSSSTATFSGCYMEQSVGSTAWSNTAAGGYNLA